MGFTLANNLIDPEIIELWKERDSLEKDIKNLKWYRLIRKSELILKKNIFLSLFPKNLSTRLII